MITLRFVMASDWPVLAARFRDLGFEQSLTYAQAAAKRIGGVARFVVLEEGGQPVAAACVRTKSLPGLRRGIAWIASGPLTLRQDAADLDEATLTGILVALRQQFVVREGHILRLRPPGLAFHDADRIDRCAAAAGFHPTRRAPFYRSVAINLRKDPAQMLADLNGKWRTDLRFAQKSGLALERGNTPALRSRFLAMFEAVQAAKGFRPDVSPEFHFALSGPDYGLDVLIATKDGHDLAGIVIGTAGASATYLFGATAEAGRSLRAGYFLTWAGLDLSRHRGLDWYDMGGIDVDANPDVARFKNRMNGTALLAEPFEARPAGIVAPLIGALEALRSRFK